MAPPVGLDGGWFTLVQETATGGVHAFVVSKQARQDKPDACGVALGVHGPV
jgi:hypothetical protein